MAQISVARQDSILYTHKLKASSLYNLMLALVYVLFVPAFVTRIINIPMWTIVRLSMIFLVDVFVAIKSQRRLLSYKLSLLISFFYLYFFVITIIIEPSELLNCFIRTITAFSCVFYTEYIFVKYKAQRSIGILLLAFEIFNYLNFLAMLRYPYGMYRVVTAGNMETLVPVTSGYTRQYGRVVWLLGHQTNLNRFTLPAISLAIIHSSHESTKTKIKLNLRSISLIVCCAIETYIANSAMNYIVFAIFLAMLILSKLYGRIKLWHIVAAIVLIYSFLIIGTDSLLGFSWISKYLGREVTLMTRLPIWINSLDYFRQSPLFGHGFINEESTAIRNILGLGNPHSAYLWVLVEGGIIGAVGFSYIVFYVTKPFRRVENGTIKRVIISAFVALIMSMITDDHIFRSQISLIIFFLCYYSPRLEKAVNK